MRDQAGPDTRVPDRGVGARGVARRDAYLPALAGGFPKRSNAGISPRQSRRLRRSRTERARRRRSAQHDLIEFTLLKARRQPIERSATIARRAGPGVFRGSVAGIAR